MNVSYEYYRVFYYVAKYQSFTKAANVLFSNQPNVTRVINKLEQALDVKLLERTHRGVLLTPEGEALYAHVRVAVEQLQSAEAEMELSAGLQGGTLSIGTTETALNVFLLDKLRAFHDAYPKIRIRISNHSTPEAMAALEKGTVDLAFVTTPVRSDKALKKTEVETYQEYLIGGSSFKHLCDKTLSVKELEKYPLIMLGRNTMSYAFYNQFFLECGATLEADMEVATTDQILPLVKGNLGMGFLPDYYAGKPLEEGEVWKIPLKEEVPQRKVLMLQDTRKAQGKIVREFIRML